MKYIHVIKRVTEGPIVMSFIGAQNVLTAPLVTSDKWSSSSEAVTKPTCGSVQWNSFSGFSVEKKVTLIEHRLKNIMNVRIKEIHLLHKDL